MLDLATLALGSSIGSVATWVIIELYSWLRKHGHCRGKIRGQIAIGDSSTDSPTELSPADRDRVVRIRRSTSV